MTNPDTRTPEEAAAEAHLTAYLAVVVSPDFTADDAHALEALLHDPPPPRVVELVQSADIRRSSGETEASPFSRVATPGAGLGALTPADRKKLLRLTRAYYADPERAPLDALVALYDKTKATPEELKQTRRRRGWDGVPTWTEWATGKELPPEVVEYGHARVTGREPAPLLNRIRGRDASFAIYSPDLVEQVLTLFDTLPREVRPVVRRSIRQGTTFLGSQTHEARKALERETGRPITEEEREKFKVFRYEPLKWAESLAITALANIAMAKGLLESHPGALTVRPRDDVPLPRVRVRLPDYPELARWCGAKPGKDGRMPRHLVRALKRAVEQLTKVPRWMAEPVLVRVGGKTSRVKPGQRLTQDLWAVAGTVLGTGEVDIDLHPLAVSAILRSFIDRGPDLYERYEAAREAIKAPQFRDEWTYLESYLLSCSNAAAAGALSQQLPAEERKGPKRKAAMKDARRARAAAALVPDGPAEGERVVKVEVSRTSVWFYTELTAVAKKQGRKEALARERDAFAFCLKMGTILSVTEREGKNGDTVFVCTMPHPDLLRNDPNQLTMLPPGLEVTP